MYLVWLRIALALYGAYCFSIVPDVLSGRSRWRGGVLPACVSAMYFHLVGLVEMLNLAHHWVPSTLHEITTLLAWLLIVAFLMVYWRTRAISMGVFVLPLVFLLLLLPAAGPDHGVFLMHGVRNGWIFVHIILLLAAYSALTISLLASLLYLIQERRLKRKQVDGIFRHLPPLETIDQIASKTLVVGFPCMTLGLLAGALIAQQSVGAIYFLDPKVLLSIGMWVLYVWMLYVRKHTGLRGKRAVYLSTLIFLLALTVWVANQFSTVHRFVTP